MPKPERHVDWLNNYFNINNVNGDLKLTSGEIADLCNKQLKTEAWTKGPPPKNRRIMTNGVDAQTVGRHMQELKKKKAGKPRATRRTQSAINRIDSVLAKRDGRLWTGDRMLLAKLNQTKPENIKNYVEEKVRQEGKRAKEAGGQVLQDWVARKRSRVASNKYANKMWAEYNKPGKKDEYLQKLENGLISLKTGEAITANSKNHPGSSLNPANGYNLSTNDGEGDDEAIDADASDAIVDDDYPMDNVIGNESESQTGYDFVADSPGYPDHINDLPQSQTQVDIGVNDKKLNLTDGNAENSGSQMGFEQNYSDANRHPVFNNAYIGVPNPRTNVFEYPASSSGIRAMTQDKGPMLATMQPYRGNTPLIHVHTSFAPSPQVQSSRYTGEPVRRRQNERCHVGPRKEEDMRACHVGYQVHKNQHRNQGAPQMLSNAQSKKRKQPLFEQGVLEVRPLKRQCKSGEFFMSGRQPESEQHLSLGQQHNELDIEERDVEESLDPNSDVGTNFSKTIGRGIVGEPKKLHERGMRVFAASTVRPRNHENADQEKEASFWDIVAHPESGLRTEHVFSRQSRESGRLDRRSGDKPENAIVIPENCEEVRTVEPSQGTSNRISVDARQPVNTDGKHGFVESASSPKGYANIWYSQGRIRTFEQPSKSPWQAYHHFDGISTAISMQPTRRKSKASASH
ncbi:uncharacterized protein EAF02_000203 [Botrytis sinoallii]|uniref:uncharacterized protein n=1 Tax=Botrytis sinoallii TaxID=1463999 RepID=UPI001900D3CC|nr:uncharacterized protein EAF02_000203 [Botrytis sinoallii]KAF7892665.1 hypothetical protein EAF02_000203 [Botrytis sinoallii]